MEKSGSFDNLRLTHSESPGDTPTHTPIDSGLADHLELHLGRKLHENEIKALLHPQHAETARMALEDPKNNLFDATQQVVKTAAVLNANQEHNVPMLNLLDELSKNSSPKLVAERVYKLVCNVLFQEPDDKEQEALTLLAKKNPEGFSQLIGFLKNPHANHEDMEAILEQIPDLRVGFFGTNRKEILRDMIKTYHEKLSSTFEAIEKQTGIPLDRDAREKIHSIAVSDGEFFQRFTDSLNMLPEEKFEWEKCYAAISEYPNSETFKNNKEAGDFVVNLLKELIDTRSSSDEKSIVNTQFNEDEFATGQKSTRRVGGIAAYQALLDKGIPDPNGQFVNDPVVVAAQKQNIQNVREFCKS